MIWRKDIPPLNKPIWVCYENYLCERKVYLEVRRREITIRYRHGWKVPEHPYFVAWQYVKSRSTKPKPENLQFTKKGE